VLLASQFRTQLLPACAYSFLLLVSGEQECSVIPACVLHGRLLPPRHIWLSIAVSGLSAQLRALGSTAASRKQRRPLPDDPAAATAAGLKSREDESGAALAAFVEAVLDPCSGYLGLDTYSILSAFRCAASCTVPSCLAYHVL
jgi:hypothetical protein